MVGSCMPEHLGRPEGIAPALELQPGEDTAIQPIAPIGGGGDADVGPVRPGDARSIYCGAAVGIQQPPGLFLPVPDDRGVGSTVIPQGRGRGEPVRASYSSLRPVGGQFFDVAHIFR